MREKIEWLNYWIEDADNGEKKRILFLGDSVARDCRKVLNRMMEKEGYVVDLLAMSHSVFDEYFIEGIQYFINIVKNSYQYQYILFNLGAHHGYSFKCSENEDVQTEYWNILEKTFKLLGQLCDNILVISGTPENRNDKDSNNDEIEKRNDVLKQAANQAGLVYVDLYRGIYDKDFSMTDRFHYLENGYEYMAFIIKLSMGFRTVSIESNKIESVKMLTYMLEKAKRIFVFGDGKRGKLLNRYLKAVGMEVFGVIVSDVYYQQGSKIQISLSEIRNRLKTGDIILVTPEDSGIWEELHNMGANFYTLGKRVYIYIEEYMNAYAGDIQLE